MSATSEPPVTERQILTLFWHPSIASGPWLRLLIRNAFSFLRRKFR